MTTIHANNANEAITRLMSMLAMGGTKLTEAMMLEMIARSLHLVVHVNRSTDGRRRVTTIAEVGEIERGRLPLHPVFEFAQEGVRSNGSVKGAFHGAGQSRLLRRFRAAGVPLHEAVLGTGEARRR